MGREIDKQEGREMAFPERYGVTESREAICQLRDCVTNYLASTLQDEQRRDYYVLRWAGKLVCLRVGFEQAEFTGPQDAFDAMVPKPESWQVRDANPALY